MWLAETRAVAGLLDPGKDGGKVRNLHDLLEWLSRAPEGTQLPASTLAAMLRPLVDAPADPEPVSLEAVASEPTWRERLWTCPAETRMGVREVAEAVGKSASWVYRHTSKKSGLPILPHRKLDGLVFLAGEVRAWLREHEESVCEVPMEGGLRVVPGRRPAA